MTLLGGLMVVAIAAPLVGAILSPMPHHGGSGAHGYGGWGDGGWFDAGGAGGGD